MCYLTLLKEAFVRGSCRLAIVYIISASSLSFAKEVTIHGFVTDVTSPTSFEIDDYKVTRDNTAAIDLGSQENCKLLDACKPEYIHVGTELEIKGEYDEATGGLKARSIRVVLEDNHRIRRTALLERIPSLTKKDSGWEGEIHADGQTITVLPTTSVTIKPNKSERKNLPDKDANKRSKLISLDVLNLDTFIHYEGTRQPSGKIEAQKIEFQHAELADGEIKLRKHYDPKVRDPDYSAFVPGELKMHWKKYRIAPDKEAQAYCNARREPHSVAPEGFTAG
jgi:hypothetical protein